MPTLDDLLATCTTEGWFVHTFLALHQQDWIVKAIACGANPNVGYTCHASGPTPLDALLGLRVKLAAGDLLPPPAARPAPAPAIDLLTLLNLRAPAPVGKVRRLP